MKTTSAVYELKLINPQPLICYTNIFVTLHFLIVKPDYRVTCQNVRGHNNHCSLQIVKLFLVKYRWKRLKLYCASVDAFYVLCLSLNKNNFYWPSVSQKFDTQLSSSNSFIVLERKGGLYDNETSGYYKLKHVFVLIFVQNVLL